MNASETSGFQYPVKNKVKPELLPAVKAEPTIPRIKTDFEDVKPKIGGEQSFYRTGFKLEVKSEPCLSMDWLEDNDHQIKDEVKPKLLPVAKEELRRLEMEVDDSIATTVADQSINQHGTAANPEADSEHVQTTAEMRKLAIQRCIQVLVHACQCREGSCRVASCQKMKKVVGHTKRCRKKCQGGCSICKHLVTLCCFHAKSCDEGKCPVPFCQSIKQKLKQQQTAAREMQARILRRRMQQMITRSQNSAGSTPPSVHNEGGAGGSSKSQQSNSQLSNGQPAEQVVAGGMKITAISRNAQPVKEWQNSMVLGVRDLLVYRVVNAVFPSPSADVLNDPRMMNLVQYAQTQELKAFETANSRDDYYNMLAENIYKMKKELEERRKARCQVTTAARSLGSRKGGSDSGISMQVNCSDVNQNLERIKLHLKDKE